MNGRTNLIEIKREGDLVAICFKPEDDHRLHRRWINANDAWAIGLVLSGSAPEQQLNFVTAMFTLQVEKQPHLGWLMMAGVRGGRSRRLTACIRDGAIARLGAILMKVSGPILRGEAGRCWTYRCPVNHFYIDRQVGAGMSA